jgi:hypothetical protein
MKTKLWVGASSLPNIFPYWDSNGEQVIDIKNKTALTSCIYVSQ